MPYAPQGVKGPDDDDDDDDDDRYTKQFGRRNVVLRNPQHQNTHVATPYKHMI
jgi:hypothetical protein